MGTPVITTGSYDSGATMAEPATWYTRQLRVFVSAALPLSVMVFVNGLAVATSVRLGFALACACAASDSAR